MNRLVVCLCLALGAVTIAGQCLAKPVGPAKPLTVGQWVKGGPVTLADGKGKNIYLVEFWATWCPPCRESVPHLTALQKKYKDQGLVVVGVSSEEPDEVKAFVTAQGDRMGYNVAVDKDEKTSQDYLEANGIDTIPHAFLIDKDGNVAWHGNPLDDSMEKALAKLLKPAKTEPRPPAKSKPVTSV